MWFFAFVIAGMFVLGCTKSTDNKDARSSTPGNNQEKTSEMTAAEGQGDEACGHVPPLRRSERALIDELLLPTHYTIDLSNVPWTGSADEDAVALVSFESYSCAHCREWSHLLMEAVERDKETFRFYFRDYPLDFGCGREEPRGHKGASFAAIGGRAAHIIPTQKGEKSLFWEMHDLIFANMSSINDPEEDVRELMVKLAGDLGLDAEKVRLFMNAPESMEALKASIAETCEFRDENGELVIKGTPQVFLNGYPLLADRLDGRNLEMRLSKLIRAISKREKRRRCIAESLDSTLKTKKPVTTNP